LLAPLTCGEWKVGNRVWMAPLTRSRATMPGNVPNAMMAAYYRQRALDGFSPGGGAGLIVSEATPVCPEGHGYYATPGLHTDEQEAGWRLVTDAVHAAGGLIVCQLWHVGRVSHTALQPGGRAPVSSTTEPSRSKVYIDAAGTRMETSPPRMLCEDEMPGVVEAFAQAAARAEGAGFDGVEIHGANTYLLDQHLRDGMNRRTDRYGGSLENRLRLPLEVAQAVCAVVGAGRVGYRISPLSEHHDARDSDPTRTFCALAERLGAMGVAYLHAVETWDRSKLDPRVAEVIPAVVRAFKSAGGGAYVANGDFTPEQAERAVGEGWADAVAFGKLFIANPDLAARVRAGGPFAAADRETFYGGNERGYTDYPALGGGEGCGESLSPDAGSSEAERTAIVVGEVVVERILHLRRVVLWPWKTVDEEARIDVDARPEGFHVAAVEGDFRSGRVVSCASMFQLPIKPPPGTTAQELAAEGAVKAPGLVLFGANTWQLRAMATDEAVRGRGVGRLALDAAMEGAAWRGAKTLWCNARLRAVAFYERAGWVKIGPMFEIPQIGPHYVMVRAVPHLRA
jgi:N-ethylmaleimide reductase